MKNICLGLVLSIVSMNCFADPREYGYALSEDVHETVTILFTNQKVDEYWNDFNYYLDNALHLQELGFEVHGLKAMYIDDNGDIKTVKTSYGRSKVMSLPKNWIVITYYGSDEVEGNIAFFRDVETGKIYHYYPNECKF